MEIKYIMGGPSSGKTSYCIEEVRQLEDEADGNILMIVPEQFSLQMEKKLVEGKGAIMKTQVLSFERLCFQIIGEVGTSKKVLLEELGKKMLLRKTVGQLELNFFKDVVKREGFIDNLSNLISDFYRYDMTPDKLNKYLNGLRDDELELTEGLRHKLDDINQIYEKYMEYVQEKYLSLDEILDVVAEKVNESEYLEGAKIFIDGFDSFNPQEYRVIEKLMAKAGEMYVTAQIHQNQGHGARYENLEMTDPYYEMKNTINNLTHIAERNNCKIAEVISLGGIHKESKELEFLANNYFYVYAKRYAQKADNIFLYRANDIYSEVEFIAKKIIKYTREGFRYNQISIITGNIEEYSIAMEKVFHLYSIPFFLDKKKDIMANQLIEFIRNALELVLHDLSYESVFAFLKSNLLGLDSDEVDMLENYVLEYGIKGKIWEKQWQWGFGNNDKKNEGSNPKTGVSHWIKAEKKIKYTKEKIYGIKDKAYKEIDYIRSRLNRRKKYEASWLSEFIFQMINHFPAREELLKANAQENIKVWEKVCEVLDKIVDIFGDSLFTVKEFLQVLEEGFRKADLGLIPEYTDLIIVGDIKRSRVSEVKILFIAGANDEILNDVVDSNQIINDSERDYLESVGMKISENSRRRIFKNSFLMYGFISKPSYQLVVSCSMKNNDEKQMFASNLFSKINSLFPYLVNDCNLDDLITVPQAMLSDVLKIIYSKDRTPKQLELYNWFRNNEIYAPKIQKFEEAVRYRNNPLDFSEHILENFSCDKLNVSISQLEKFAQCPFAYFLCYRLCIDERKIYKLKTVDIGSFLHSVLKEFFMMAKRDGLDKLIKDKGQNYMDVLRKYVDLAISKSEFDENIFNESAYYKFLLYHSKNVLFRSIGAMLDGIEQDKYLPSEFEFEFKNIKLDDNVFLNGKIDRIDVLDTGSEKYLRVIDYKSGDKKFSVSDVHNGLQLQLLIYLKVLSDNVAGITDENTNIKPGGAFYFPLSDPFVEIKSEMDDSQLKKKMAEEFKMSGTKEAEVNELMQVSYEVAKNICYNIMRGDVSINPHSDVACSYCPYHAICGKERKNVY